MNYELARKLKDAGFPYLTIDGKILSINCITNHEGETIPIPTLSELIEACGDRFHSLGRESVSPNKKGKWYAATDTHECNCKKNDCNGYNWEVGEGSTPEEAVANLWLELNK